MPQTLKDRLRLALRYPLSVLARTLPLPFLPRRLVSDATDVDGPQARIDEVPAVRIAVPLLPEPHETEYQAVLAKGQALHDWDIPARGAFAFCDATVVMPESVAMRKGRILRESVPFVHFFDTVLFIKDWLRPRPDHRASSKAAFLLTIPIARNYHLWVHYALPRLLFWERLPDRAEVAILVSEDAPGFVTGALAIYARRFPELTVERAPRARVAVDRLIVAEPMSVEDLPSPIAVEWLRRTFIPSNARPERSILVSRRGALEREILNEDELLESLSPFGFERFDPAHATFEEQIQAFAAARRIVAPHGAALASLAFAPADAHVVELLGGSHVFACFRFLAAEIGARYDAVACTTQGPHLVVDAAQRAQIVRLLDEPRGALPAVS